MPAHTKAIRPIEAELDSVIRRYREAIEHLHKVDQVLGEDAERYAARITLADALRDLVSRRNYHAETRLAIWREVCRTAHGEPLRVRWALYLLQLRWWGSAPYSHAQRLINKAARP